MRRTSPAGAAPPRDVSYDLLARLTRLDDDEYEDAAGPGGGRRSGLGLGVATVALAVLVTVAALQTQAGRPQAERDREVLLARLEQEQTQVAGLSDRTEAAAREVAALRTRVSGAGESAQQLQAWLDRLGPTVGSAAVRGPGVRVVVDDSDDGAPEGAITDADLQQLVNGLWQAGAEAVAVNGQRLTALSAIRTAGEAITVNYRSLAPPYTVSAIGDAQTLPARLLETPAGQTFTDLSNNFGVGFEVNAAEELALPAGSRLAIDLATAASDGAGATDLDPTGRTSR